jgi:hypothetical protein
VHARAKSTERASSNMFHVYLAPFPRPRGDDDRHQNSVRASTSSSSAVDGRVSGVTTAIVNAGWGRHARESRRRG